MTFLIPHSVFFFTRFITLTVWVGFPTNQKLLKTAYIPLEICYTYIIQQTINERHFEPWNCKDAFNWKLTVLIRLLPKESIVCIVLLDLSLCTQSQVPRSPSRWPGKVECPRVQELLDLRDPLLVSLTIPQGQEVSRRDSEDFWIAYFTHRQTASDQH